MEIDQTLTMLQLAARLYACPVSLRVYPSANHAGLILVELLDQHGRPVEGEVYARTVAEAVGHLLETLRERESGEKPAPMTRELAAALERSVRRMNALQRAPVVIGELPLHGGEML